MILMKYENKGGDGDPDGHPFSPNAVSGIGNGLHLVKLLVKGFPYEFPNSPGCCQDYTLFSTNRD